jgi:hypothetical protein
MTINRNFSLVAFALAALFLGIVPQTNAQETKLKWFGAILS